MNNKTIRHILIVLILSGCAIFIPKICIAMPTLKSDDSSNNIISNSYDIISKNFNVFSKENYKYLSTYQRNKLAELNEQQKNGIEFSEDKKEYLNSLINYIALGKLGNKDYSDFKSLLEKKSSNRSLTEDENYRFNDYINIIDGNKLSTKDILDQFLR